MVTANDRLDCFKRSFQCYIDQIYPNKELVIVNEGSKEYQNQIEKHVSERNDVKLVFLKGWYSLGSLRNISIALCNGDLFVQWDDDDFNSPERLSVQFNHLSKSQAKVCYLSEQLHYYFDTKQLFWESWAKFCSGGHKKYSLIPGTGMAWKKEFGVRYPSAGEWCSAGEDSVLAYKLCDNEDDVFLLAEYGHMQMYSFHGKNVWDSEHHLKISKERSMERSYVLRHRDRICGMIDYLKLEGIIKIMSRDGLVFTHEAKNDMG
jgi:glycosyltransferase involved in cell wall biosynthesis